jgi:hypothetical protein
MIYSMHRFLCIVSISLILCICNRRLGGSVRGSWVKGCHLGDRKGMPPQERERGSSRFWTVGGGEM